MPRWRSLPEDLDPQIREFASQLRRLVDRSGLSVATVADRTGYSKSSWERYLNGRLLPPRGATQALAEVTGTDVRHLGTMWELAERAWSRSEMRRDATLEAIQIAQARAALDESPEQASGKGRKRRKGRGPAQGPTPEAGPPAQEPAADGGTPAVPHQAAPQHQSAPQRRDFGPGHGVPPQRGTPGQGETPGLDGTPQDPSGGPGGQDVETAVLRTDAIRAAGDKARADRAAGDRQRPDEARADGARPDKARERERRHRSDATDWGTPAPATAPATGGRPTGPVGDRGTGGAPGGTGLPSAPGGSAPGAPVPASAQGAEGDRAAQASGGRRRITVLLASLVAVLVVAAGAVLFFGTGEDGKEEAAAPKPAPSRTASQLPAGVKCSGEDCSGKDPEAMGCGGKHAATSSSAWVGSSFVEVRHSTVCKASWARITSAKSGDALRISGPGGQAESDEVTSTNDAYTKMVSVGTQDEARACATLAAGGKGCTVPGKKVR
ncbi:helix-turn-helix domain-containing protein [Streptomyces qinglanensis]|uniref:helix-turn-helix domain-containing protein n=1 Tax=Streptomyces qinglanensis TaxID=943816 RepID=UPI003D718286